MTTVPQGVMPPLIQPPHNSDDVAITGKGQVDSTPPSVQGVGPDASALALAITGEGQVPRAGVPLDEAK